MNSPFSFTCLFDVVRLTFGARHTSNEKRLLWWKDVNKFCILGYVLDSKRAVLARVTAA